MGGGGRQSTGAPAAARWVTPGRQGRGGRRGRRGGAGRTKPRRPHVVLPRQDRYSSVRRDPEVHGGAQEDRVDDKGTAQADDLVEHKFPEPLAVQTPRAKISRDQKKT